MKPGKEKSERLVCFATPRQNKLIRKVAEAKGLGLSEYMRLRLLEAAKKDANELWPPYVVKETGAVPGVKQAPIIPSFER